MCRSKIRQRIIRCRDISGHLHKINVQYDDKIRFEYNTLLQNAARIMDTEGVRQSSKDIVLRKEESARFLREYQKAIDLTCGPGSYHRIMEYCGRSFNGLLRFIQHLTAIVLE